MDLWTCASQLEFQKTHHSVWHVCNRAQEAGAQLFSRTLSRGPRNGCLGALLTCEYKACSFKMYCDLLYIGWMWSHCSILRQSLVCIQMVEYGLFHSPIEDWARDQAIVFMKAWIVLILVPVCASVQRILRNSLSFNAYLPAGQRKMSSRMCWAGSTWKLSLLNISDSRWMSQWSLKWAWILLQNLCQQSFLTFLSFLRPWQCFWMEG